MHSSFLQNGRLVFQTNNFLTKGDSYWKLQGFQLEAITQIGFSRSPVSSQILQDWILVKRWIERFPPKMQ